ncbi:polysaccharide deacetylase [Sphingomonas floccifaciens]|uniref:Polysaccharide deacetylase n=1 Tax=Sphingomonas floccifaciens TaxID=1844115 RepID=A0ABW4N900_9SPHN
MATRVFLTIDTAMAWRHHAAGLSGAEVARRSFDPAGVGIGYQLEMFARYGLKASFFVDPMSALVHGIAHVARVVDEILIAGQEVQLHLNPGWSGADIDDRSRHDRFELSDYSAAEQRALIEQASDLLTTAGAPTPIAFRAGNYAANDDTLAALAALRFAYDSSHNGARHSEASAIPLPPRQIAPLARGGLTEVPVTLIEDHAGMMRDFHLGAVSVAEMRAALDHAARENHAAVTIAIPGADLANCAGTAANGLHVRRFEALCVLLAEWAGQMPTTHFADRPPLRLDAADTPLGPDPRRTRWRQAEQLWSTLVSGRAA